MKVCSKCDKELPLKEFRRSKKTLCGFLPNCKTCKGNITQVYVKKGYSPDRVVYGKYKPGSIKQTVRKSKGIYVPKRSVSTWLSMINRVESLKDLSYSDCSIHSEWIYFSSFQKWFDKNYVKGYQLDKDLKVIGNREYGKDTCIFIPAWLNSGIILPDSQGYNNKPSGNYEVVFHAYGKRRSLGTYKTKERATLIHRAWRRSYLLSRARREGLSHEIITSLTRYCDHFFPKVVG